MNAVLASLGERIRAARFMTGMRQEDLAGKVGLTRSSIANIESGRQDTTVTTLVAIADALCIRVSDLLGEPRDIEPLKLATALAGTQRRLAHAFAEFSDLLQPVMADMERVNAMISGHGAEEENHGD